jgi:ketosteroid isomerase-like protein
MSKATEQLLDEFFAAIQRGDIDTVASLYADDVEVWHNVTRSSLAKAASLDLLRYWTRTVTNMRYHVLERRTFDGGAVQRHVVHGTAHGTSLEVPVCIVFHVDGGRITRIYEYLDQAAVAAVFGDQPRSRPTR